MLAPGTTGAARPRDAGGDPKNQRLPGALDESNNTDATDWQLLSATTVDVAGRLRVDRLRRRFGLDDAMAALVSELAFPNSGRRA